MDSKIVSLLYGIILVTGMNIAGTYGQGECTQRKVDLAFLFDGSESLKADDFKKNKDFIADMMKTLSNTSIQFAAMQFSKTSRTVFTFKDYQEKKALDLLEKEQHMKDLTNTYGAMYNVREKILNSTTAGAIPDATKVLVIISDGNPSDKDWRKVVKTMDDRHITRYVIGVGNVAWETLIALSSQLPNKNTAFPINDYDGLKGVLDSLQKQICNIEDVQKSNRSDALEEEKRELSISLSSVEQRLAECTKRKVDLAFLFDGSESLTADDFKKNKDFIADMMKTLSNTSIQFAAMQFSKTSRTVFTFKDYQEKKALDLLEKEQHMKDLTNTYGAMNNVLEIFFNNTTAGAIPDATKVLVIISDGNPSDKDWKKVVKTMDDRHITRYVIGVGNVAWETLIALSSHLPNKITTFPINDYHGLKGVLDSLQKQICNIEDIQKSNRSDALEEENRELSIFLSSVEQRLADIKRNLEELQVKHRDLWKIISHYNAMDGCACLTGWRLHQGKCYFFSTEKMHWSQSQEYCASKGAHLVIIKNQQEQNFVSSSIRETHWIGLSDRNTEGQWVWVDGTPLDRSGTQYWCKTEPDNWMGAGDPSGEDCAALGKNNEHPDYWFDSSCRNMKKFVCETTTILNKSGPEYLVSP